MTVDDIFTERLQIWSDIQGHLQFMHDVVVEADAKTVVELGVRSGNSTAALLAGVQKTGGHLWSVDTEPIDLPAPISQSKLWTPVVGDDLAVTDWLPKEIDVLFIDTNHWYHHTLAELRLYGPSSKIILMHDTELEWPWQAPPGDPSFPVRKAIEHYLQLIPERNVEWREGSYGLAVIQ